MKLIHKILITFLTFAILIFIINIVRDKPWQRKEYKLKPANIDITSLTSEKESLKPFSYYKSGLDKRNFFIKAGAKKEPEKIARQLVLAGISYDGNIFEALLQDEKTKEVIVVREGDEYKGYKVASVLKDQIVLIYNGKEIILK